MMIPKLNAAQHLGYTSKIGDLFFFLRGGENIDRGKKKKLRRKREDCWMSSIDLEIGFAKQGEKEPSLVYSVYGY